MKKINLENVEEFKPFPKVNAGGYVCGVYAVEDVADKEYLKITYDIIEGENKGFYTNLKKDKGWDLPLFIASYKDSALSFFKGTITSFEKSNANFKFGNDEQALKGKKVGLVLFEEEYIKGDGSIGIRMKVDKAHSVDAIKKGDFETPERKCIAQTTSAPKSAFSGFGSKPSTTTQADPFADVVEDVKPNNSSASFPFADDEDLPFQ